MHSVLITGGAGFFGQHLSRYLLDNNLSGRICIYSRGEHAQAQMRDRFNGDSRLRFFVGDVRDRQRLEKAMTGCCTVVHAAALKRIEVGIYDPIEMIRTNVDGSINVIEAAQRTNVDKVVYLSTDKAWNPVSLYGKTKSISEDLFLTANNTVSESGPRFAVTRYGNVFASTGSVVPRWKALIAAGHHSVPVSDPECTRFFMTAEEAVAMVIEACHEIDKGRAKNLWRSLLIPELPAYRLGDLAEAMCVQMDIQGLPSWEKKHEGMTETLTSDRAYRMPVKELRHALDRFTY